MSEPTQITLDPIPRKIPPKTRPKRKLTPGSVAWKIWNYLRKQYKPVTEAHIQRLPIFSEHTVGNRLRDLRMWGYVQSEEGEEGRQVWRAIYH